VSKRRVLNEMLGGERRDLTEGFDLARQAAALKKKHTDGLQKDLSTLAKEGAKQLTSAGHSVSVARAELTHKGSPMTGSWTTSARFSGRTPS
jgi:hypothetical protein